MGTRAAGIAAGLDGRRTRRSYRALVGAAIAVTGAVSGVVYAQGIEWTAYGHDAAGTRFSPAVQISRANVSQLRVAWTYRTGDLLRDDRTGEAHDRFEATPLFVDRTLFLSTPLGTVFALDPEHGTTRWYFDARVDLSADYGDFASRGVSTWLDRTRAPGAACRRRIFVAPIDARLIALDATTGRPCADFGIAGQVNLALGVRNPASYKGEYEITSPPAVIGDLIVVGSSISDNQRTDAPSGVVRAYDARTGALKWSWDPIPRHADLAGYDTWQGPHGHETGAANAWSVISADTARGLLFVPVGSASPDFYGGERLGQNLYANSVVALRAATGAIAWYFQVVHHDLWDYDVPAQPVLVDLRRPGTARSTPAVVVATKMGRLFVLDRMTGKPLFPVEERPAPPSDVPGEQAWPTQPFPVRPAPLTPERLAAADAWGITPDERDACRKRMTGLRSEGIFTPPSLAGTIIFPGNIGGFNWSGVAWDPAHALIIGPTNRLAFDVRLVPRSIGRADLPHNLEYGAQRGTPYAMLRDPILSPNRIPCNPPPWGTLDAIDLTSGNARWESPLDAFPALAGDTAYRRWGSLNLGGAMITGGGLVFVAGGFDDALHAFDVETGRELWSGALPAGAQAMPMTYQTDSGHQFVVVVAGGHDRLHTSPGDYVVAFALPSTSAATPPARRRDVAGTYDGVVRIGDGAYYATWTLTQSDQWVDGRFVGETPSAISGDVAGAFTGDTLHVNSRWDLPARHCRGTLSADISIENQGQLLEAPVHVWADCGQRAEIGTLVLRRAR